MQSIISIEDITCPITREIFCDPCIASDGNTYEREYITKWLEKNNTSPLTREPMDSKIYSNNLIKRMVDEYLEMYSDEKNNQYKPGVTYMLNRSIIKKSIEENNFDNLTKFTDYDIKDMHNNNNIILKLVEKCKNETVLKHIIDNCIDLECVIVNGWKLIHFICRYSTPKMIKYIIDKNVDLECVSINKWKPIHHICRISTPEMIKYIIDKNVDLECVNIDGWKPIHFICKYSTPEMIKYIIDKNVDLECVNNDGWKPIHFICKYSTPEMIKYIIDKNVDTKTIIKKYDDQDIDYDCVKLIELNDNINSDENSHEYQKLLKLFK